MSWSVMVPVWGDEYAARFAITLPSTLAAFAKREVRFIIHTDRPDWCRERLEGHEAVFLPVPSGSLYNAFAACHREAVGMVPAGEMVMVLTADIVPSIETVDACERLFDAGWKLVMAPALRTLSDDPPPSAADAGTLARWQMEHLHPSMAGNTWGGEFICTPAVLLFRSGQSLIMRAFHLHPIAFVKSEGLDFSGTCDIGIPACFTPAETHVVKDTDGFCLVEMSPRDKDMGISFRATSRSVALWAMRHTNAAHRWTFLNHRIVLEGEEVWDVDNILAEKLEWAFKNRRLPL